MSRQSEKLKEDFGNNKKAKMYYNKYKFINKLDFFMYFYRFPSISLDSPVNSFIKLQYHNKSIIFHIKISSDFKLNRLRGYDRKMYNEEYKHYK